MKFDFDTLRDRRNTSSLKWDVRDNELPMWVADMDFKTCPSVIEALEKKVNSGIFGYSIVSDSWYESIINWWKRRHDFTLEKEWLIFTTGVLPAITCAVKRITNVGDNVLVLTPAYDIFFNSIENHGRHVLESNLVYEEKSYTVDFEDLEEKLSHPLTTMMILCNPHNPIGKIWSKEELKVIGELCKKHNVIVLSDEIHCDLTAPNREYIPFASVSKDCEENSITCMSATKAFNMAGLQTAIVSVPNKSIREKMNRGLNSDEVAEPNAFAIEAVIAAFTEGEQWLDELREYIEENKKIVSDFISKEIPEIDLVSSQSTYLLWLDCSNITEDARKLCEEIRSKTGLYLSCGNQYRGNGNYFVRMNVACPKATVQEGLMRLKEGIRLFEKEI